jgi:hypothetical protein
MIKLAIRTLAALVLLALATVGGVAAAEAFPEPFFANHTELGRLSLYSDRPFNAANGRAILADVDARLATSPIDDRGPHAIFVANAPWREALFFNTALGAAGVNHSPLSRNVFMRHSDIDSDTVFGRSGRPAAPPRTLAYYGAHELTHSLTAERLGPGQLWNAELPQWVREGYADYVGMGGRVDIDDLYRRYRAGDPTLDYRRSGLYTRFRLLTAVMLEREHWSVDRLLASKLTQAQAEALMNKAMARPAS